MLKPDEYIETCELVVRSILKADVQLVIQGLQHQLEELHLSNALVWRLCADYLSENKVKMSQLGFVSSQFC